MCGIVGGVMAGEVLPVLMNGLKSLEYRGYDSAGIAVLDDHQSLQCLRAVGKVQALEDRLSEQPVTGGTGIAHTRWATHGVPSEDNAHPHVCNDDVAIVHNGIIENHEQLRSQQKQRGHDFNSQTDTEVIVHQIHDFLEEGLDLLQAVSRTCAMLEGAFALGVVAKSNPGRLITARRGSPLVIGVGEGENFIASDVFALLGKTKRFIFLEDGDIADITCLGVTIFNEAGERVERKINETELEADSIGLGRYDHYMQKEIFEQAAVMRKTLGGRIRHGQLTDECFAPAVRQQLQQVKEVQIVACGTSFHAGLVAKYWLESLIGVPCHIEVASEFRYRPHVVAPQTLFVTISQSGETADTLAALQSAKSLGYTHTLTICNVPESSLVRESEWSLMTNAGPEIGVASTKAFTTQLTALLLMISAMTEDKDIEEGIVHQLEDLPEKVAEVLRLEPQIKVWASQFGDKNHALYLGRGEQYPVAMEGALKLKEISYIHAEAYPAGELKHGPLALIDEQMPVVAVAPNNELLEKLKSNLQEVQARGGQLFVFADVHAPMDASPGLSIIRVDEIDDVIAPIIYTIPLQLLAYHVALIKGTDVDQPRNLAKSVTVE